MFIQLFLIISMLVSFSPIQAETVYTDNQTWKVNNEWELKVLGVHRHTSCDSVPAGKEVVFVTYQIKNLGNARLSNRLSFYPSEVKDEFGNIGEDSFICNHSVEFHSLIPKGTNGICSVPFVFPKKTNSVNIKFFNYTSTGEEKTASFKIKVTNNKPAYKWNTKREVPSSDIGYKAGQTWTIPNVAQIKLNGASLHNKCYATSFPGEQVVFIDYTYINKGYGNLDGGLLVYPEEVYDEFGNAAEIYNCSHSTDPEQIAKVGAKFNAKVSYLLPKTSKYVYVDFAVVDKNFNLFTATFVTGVGSSSNIPQPKKLAQPKLVAIYNSAHGADIRFKPVSGATHYDIMRKEDGSWYIIDEVAASSLSKEGSNLKYIDVDVKDEYGRGYIYSVSACNPKTKEYSSFDSLGLPLYRLKQPSIKSITNKGNGKVEIKWSKENCQGYEVQYSVDNGKTWSKAPQVNNGNTTSQTISNLKLNKQYVFRIRCQKTNKDRGTTWSQYSPWSSITVK